MVGLDALWISWGACTTNTSENEFLSIEHAHNEPEDIAWPLPSN